MGEFKRSPSKVWWANESVEWREISSSPGSQDSGFSDTEPCPPETKNITPKISTPAQRIPKDIFKELALNDKPQNLTINYIEKSTPNKLISTQLNNSRIVKTEVKPTARYVDDDGLIKTEPIARKNRYTKNSPKISRNLFNTIKQKEQQRDVTDNQYSENVITHSNLSEETTYNNDYSLEWQQSNSAINHSESLPCLQENFHHISIANRSAPTILEFDILRQYRDDEAVTSFNNSLSSDCESELECLFNSSPKHTSTPKTGIVKDTMRLRRQKHPIRLLEKYDERERVPPIHTVNTDDYDDNKAVQKWMEETRQTYEQECMVTLQCKSIAGDLNLKVSHLAACFTTNIRVILSHGRGIVMEYRTLNSEKKHLGPLIQSLTGNINDFIKNNKHQELKKIQFINDKIRSLNPEDALKELSELYRIWENIYDEILTKETIRLVDTLENPTSELNLRGIVLAITSIALRNEELIEYFTKADIIPILLILCEKCQGSTLRSLLLRALSTMCSNSSAVRQFEKYSGIQILTDVMQDEKRPEPERSEAIALLAQVTAPWLEDNNWVRGLQDYSHIIVKFLTKFISSTKCCQNLLLATAAIANLSSMDHNCVMYMLKYQTISILLQAVRKRGPGVSIYLLEQMATLMANISTVEGARLQLTLAEAPVALLGYLQYNQTQEDVAKRLQQKTIIALSRLCADRNAAEQIVENGGLTKLVKICRERSERYDNNAVLVAALATLRKIADSCGSAVLNAQDVQELIEPKLLDSFKAYSSQNESYV